MLLQLLVLHQTRRATKTPGAVAEITGSGRRKCGALRPNAARQIGIEAGLRRRRNENRNDDRTNIICAAGSSQQTITSSARHPTFARRVSSRANGKGRFSTRIRAIAENNPIAKVEK